MKMILLMLASLLAGCSILHLMPSASCSYVKYERIQDTASVNAEGCKV
jgi:uncharacterized protein YceK